MAAAEPAAPDRSSRLKHLKKYLKHHSLQSWHIAALLRDAREKSKKCLVLVDKRKIVYYYEVSCEH